MRAAQAAVKADVEAGTISGAVFQDYNSNGTRDTSGAGGTAIDRGIAGVNVYAYDDAGTRCGSTTSGSNGGYTLSHTCAGPNVRVEFTGLPFGYFEAPSGPNSGGAVQVVSANATNVNLGINHPCDYCQANPKVLEATYVNGAINGTGQTQSVVTFNYDTTSNLTIEATKIEVGSTWGLAWNREYKKAFVSAVLKRHVGLGPGGLGAIYVTDFATAGSPTVYLTTIPNVGSINGANRGLANSNQPSYDTDAFAKAAKTGLGDLDISEDGKTLYVVNLNQKKVVAVNIASYLISGTLPTSGDITNLPNYPSTTCANGTDRPWGMSVYRGNLYLGVVCDASSGSAANLNARVYAYSLASGTWNSVLGPFALNYSRGTAWLNATANFNGWTDTAMPSGWFFSVNNNYDSLMSRAQPILADIEFDNDGSMLLGFADRAGFQTGAANYSTSGTQLYHNIAEGELLRAYNNNGAFVLESGGTTAAGGGCGTGGASVGGIGGGEYFCGDVWNGSNGSHQEVMMGGLGKLPGTSHVIAAAMNPEGTVYSGGVRKLSSSTGQYVGGFEIYAGGHNFVDVMGKSMGTGDVELLCDPAPTEIGNRVWNDTNGDGTQDPSEGGISGLTVRLVNAGGTQLATTTTNAQGQYKFNSTSIPGLTPNTNGYRILVNTAQAGVSGLSLTALDAPAKGQDSTQDDSDSDAVLNGADAQITFNTGQAGASSSSYDFGFGNVGATIGDRVWNDLNSNGQQDGSELGVPGAIVKLLSTSDVVLLSTATDVNGIYSFINVTPGSYKVQFVKPSGFNFTTANVGPDVTDSDADTATGVTGVFAVIAGETNNTIDAGLQSIKANLNGRAWNDLNRNGQQDAGEPGFVNVAVSLFSSGGTLLGGTTTDATSRYTFNNLEPGSYQVRFVAPVNFGFTAANVGPDATDSDANAITGITALIPLAPGQTSTSNDAGFILTKANLTGRVWTDLNRDGQRVGGEPPVGGVTVQLLDNGGALLQSTTTDVSGYYEFLNINPSTYKLKFVQPVGYLGLTLANVGNDATDSDPEVATATTAAITLVAGETRPSNDAGLWVANAVVGDYVWLDLNNNGLQDGGEVGMPEADVTLYNASGNVFRVQTTDANGKYTFTEVPPGAYSLGFALPSSFALTKQKQGNNPAIDSDPHPDTARTAMFTLLPGESNLTLDAGVRHVKPQIRVDAFVNDIGADAAPGPAFARNTVVTVTYVISNSGNTSLAEIVLTDQINNVDTTIATCPTTLLAEGESMICTTTRSVSAGQNRHLVTVTATIPSDQSAIAQGGDFLFYFGN